MLPGRVFDGSDGDTADTRDRVEGRGSVEGEVANNGGASNSTSSEPRQRLERVKNMSNDLSSPPTTEMILPRPQKPASMFAHR